MYSTEGLISATNEINVVKFQNFNLNFQRSSVEERLFIPSVLILRGMKLFLNTSTAVLLISLYGDVEINPGPSTQSMRYTEELQPQSSTKIQHQLLRNSCPSVNCVVLNARSLTSAHKKNDQIFSNMNCMQNFLIAENIDIAFVTKTWLTKNILDNEILACNDFKIFRRQTNFSGGKSAPGCKIVFILLN